MQSKFDACVSFVLEPANDGQPFHVTPHDPGGATAYGITAATLARWRQIPASNEDVAALTIDEARSIYRARYWQPINGDRPPAGVDLMVFDDGVNCGERTSARALQAAVQVTMDGFIGPITLAEVTRRNPTQLIRMLAILQEQHYRSLPGFLDFGGGWLARLDRRASAALKMVGA